MRAAGLMLAAMLAALSLGAANLPPRAEALRPKALEAERLWREARASAEAAEADAAPLADDVKAMKAAKDAGWWQAFKLRRRMAALKGVLDECAKRRARERDARDHLFVLLTGIQEELRSALDRDLARGKLEASDLARLREYLRQKEVWEKVQEEVGLGTERPFPQGGAAQPQGSQDPAWKADQIQALRARVLQLEAWREQIKADLRVFSRAQALGVLNAGQSRGKIADFKVLLKAAERQANKAEEQLKALGGAESLP